MTLRLDCIDRRTFTACAVTLLYVTIAAAADTGLTVSQGFEVTRFATDELAHDIFSMTIDARGRVVVSGPGYVRTLIDDDHDGRADRAVQFSDLPKSGAQGLLFLGNDLLYTGDGGLWLLRDKDGDGVADGSPERWLKLNNAEHGAHAITMGPDGWVYVMCGNNAGMSAEQVTDPDSPISNPIAGCVVRIRADGTQVGIVADGFRNPYDLGFNSTGHLFTVDSDGERSHHLPWYTPTRMFDISFGEQHGWVLPGWQRSWSRPEEFFDNVPRVCELGRGSPSGLVVYQHRAFPSHYHGGVFTACWTLGRVYFVKLTPKGASYSGEPEVFLETAGDIGFAPVDLAVGPHGDLFVAVGGRGTQGGVFRVRHTEGTLQPTTSDLSVDKLLNAEQPLSSWSRAQWLPLAHALGSEELIDVAGDLNSSSGHWSSAQRMRAIEVLTELDPRRIVDFVHTLDVSDDPQVVARAAWAISRASNVMRAADLEKARTALAAMTHAKDLFVQRAAWAALCLMNDLSEEILGQLAWASAFDSTSRQVRSDAIRTAERSTSAPDMIMEQIDALPATSRTGRLYSSLLWTHQGDDSPDNTETPDAEIQKCLTLLTRCNDPSVRLEIIRLIERWLGDINAFVKDDLLSSGYTLGQLDAISPATRQAIADSLIAIFPTDEANLDREVARLMAMIAVESPAVLDAISMKWTPESSPVDDVHYLTVLSKLGGTRPRPVTQRTATALVNLHEKLEARHWYPSREWPTWVAGVFVALVERDAALPVALVANPSFGRPDHAMFVLHMSKDQKEIAAQRLYDRLGAADDEETSQAWTATLVEALSVLPDDILFPRLREVWDEGLLRDAIVGVLARSPLLVDRHRYLAALERSQPAIVEAVVEPLLQLTTTAPTEDVAIAIRRLRRSCLSVGSRPATDDKQAAAKYRRGVAEQQPMRQQLDRLLRHWSGQDFEISEHDGLDLLDQYRPWFTWFGETYPDSADEILVVSTTTTSWASRMEDVDWSTGEVGRGQIVYRRKACNQCHDGNSRLGPELAPAVKRFSRDDLFAAVINPSANISPQYQGVQVVTRAGRVYQGLPVYDSPEGLLLRTGPETTVRLTGDEIELRQPSTQSFMPQGLLDDLSDDELADLYAYLRSLR